jgi:hypothetical protein
MLRWCWRTTTALGIGLIALVVAFSGLASLAEGFMSVKVDAVAWTASDTRQNAYSVCLPAVLRLYCCTPLASATATSTPVETPALSRTPTTAETMTSTPTATASATQTNTPTLTPSPTFTSTATNTPTQTPTPSPTETATVSGLPDVKVAAWCSQFDAPGNDNQNLNEEYVCFENQGGSPAAMTGWNVKDEYGHTYTFPEFTLPAGAHALLRSGSGIDSLTDLYWGRSVAVWNNGGDTVFLYNEAWELVDEHSYH